MRKLAENIFEVGTIDWDRRLFDELIPLPDGTSYNTYLIKGSEKNCLLDTVDPPKVNVLAENLKAAGIKQLDYVVAHHAEQDHSGTLPAILESYPHAKVVTNQKCRDMLIDLLCISEDKFYVIEDSRKLSLGDKTLEFISTPWVHWPETFSSYCPEEKILFSCDFFGSHLACSNLFVEDECRVLESAKRYYAEIMMPFRKPIRNNLKKLEDFDIGMIAPSHGPIYQNPKVIMDAYNKWTGEQVENKVVVAYVSMHGSTKKMTEYLVEKLIEKGIDVKQYNLTVTDIGELAMDTVDAATVILGVPTTLTQAHPVAGYAVNLLNLLRPKTRYAGLLGSYGWGGKTVKQVTEGLPRLDVEFLEPVMIKGYQKKKDFEAIDKLTEQIEQKHKEDVNVK